MADFTHVDGKGNVLMVDVSGKTETSRTAVASGKISMSEECYRMVVEHRMKKGDVLCCAQVAGIMGVKKTPDLIPMAHPIPLDGVKIEFSFSEGECAIIAKCKVNCHGVTGVEMEALTGVSTALLTVYDMCKAVDKSMVISEIHLEEKHGGKSGDYYA